MTCPYIVYFTYLLRVAQMCSRLLQENVNSDTLVETRANRAKVEAVNFLDDRSKVLQTLSSFPVCSTLLKHNTSLPSSAPAERSSALED